MIRIIEVKSVRRGTRMQEKDDKCRKKCIWRTERKKHLEEY